MTTTKKRYTVGPSGFGRGWSYECHVEGCGCRGGSVDYDRCERLAEAHIAAKHPELVNPLAAERRLQVNADPLLAAPLAVCRQCNRRAPWCSCGAADYATGETSEESVRG